MHTDALMPTKRATNLTLSCDTLEAAKRLKINLSQVCDDYLTGVRAPRAGAPLAARERGVRRGLQPNARGRGAAAR